MAFALKKGTRANERLTSEKIFSRDVVSNDAEFDNVIVNTTTTLNGNTNINGVLTVSGTSTITDTLNVIGTQNISGELNISGSQYIDGTLEVTDMITTDVLNAETGIIDEVVTNIISAQDGSGIAVNCNIDASGRTIYCENLIVTDELVQSNTITIEDVVVNADRSLMEGDVTIKSDDPTTELSCFVISNFENVVNINNTLNCDNGVFEDISAQTISAEYAYINQLSTSTNLTLNNLTVNNSATISGLTVDNNATITDLDVYDGIRVRSGDIYTICGGVYIRDISSAITDENNIGSFALYNSINGAASKFSIGFDDTRSWLQTNLSDHLLLNPRGGKIGVGLYDVSMYDVDVSGDGHYSGDLRVDGSLNIGPASITLWEDNDKLHIQNSVGNGITISDSDIICGNITGTSLDVNNGNINGGSLTLDGKVSYPLKKHYVTMSDDNHDRLVFYPVEISQPPIENTHYINIYKENKAYDNSFNQQNIYGTVKNGGWSDQNPPFVDLINTVYDERKHTIYGIYSGLQDGTSIVVYLRGGYNYTIDTYSNSVSLKDDLSGFLTKSPWFFNKQDGLYKLVGSYYPLIRETAYRSNIFNSTTSLSIVDPSNNTSYNLDDLYNTRLLFDGYNYNGKYTSLPSLNLRVCSTQGAPDYKTHILSNDVLGKIEFGAEHGLGSYKQYPASIVALAESDYDTFNHKNNNISSKLEFRTLPITNYLDNDSATPITRMTINKDGNVGIGITDPSSYKFDVSGNGRVRGDFRVDGSFNIGPASITMWEDNDKLHIKNSSGNGITINGTHLDVKQGDALFIDSDLRKLDTTSSMMSTTVPNMGEIMKFILPVGTIQVFTGQVIQKLIGSTNVVTVGNKSSWLVCNGNSFDRTIFPDLCNTLYSTVLPDLQERTIFGFKEASTYTASYRQTGGYKTISTTQMPSHNHTATVSDQSAMTINATTDTKGGHRHDITVPYDANDTTFALMAWGAIQDSNNTSGTANTNDNYAVKWNKNRFGSTMANSLQSEEGSHNHNVSITVPKHSHTVTINNNGGGSNFIPQHFAAHYIIFTGVFDY